MVELTSKKFVCIVDESKLVEGLGGSKGDSRKTHCMATLAGPNNAAHASAGLSAAHSHAVIARASAHPANEEHLSEAVLCLA